MTRRMNFAALLGGAIVAAHFAVAQPCQPDWDTTIGSPGISSGYVGAIREWNDGGGDDLYVGGSFDNIIGVGGTKLLARWNRETNAWSSVGGGMGTGFTNGFITSILPYFDGQEELLVVAGFFADAAGTPDTKSIAAWNGSSWRSIGASFPSNSANSVWSMHVWNGTGNSRLYVGGGFTIIAGQNGVGVAAWDGEAWQPLATTITGFSPTVFALTSFNDGSGDKLYAAGRFDTINGVNARLVARWNGTSWSAVGAGLVPNASTSDISALVVFDDGNGAALYAGGYDFRPNGGTSSSVVKWNGTNWTRVGQAIGGRVTTLRVFDDGGGPKLYAGGTAQPGIQYFSRLEGNSWVTVAGGVGGDGVPPSQFPSVFAMREWGNALYVGGNFTLAGGEPATGLAAYTGCPTLLIGDLNCDGLVNNFDITPFVLALSDAAAYEAEFPDCDRAAADVNGDGLINNFDIDAFVALIGG